MNKLVRIKVGFLARISGQSGGLLGMLAGTFYSIGGFVYDLLFASLNIGTAMAFMALLIMPLLFAVMFFLIGAIIASIYNLGAQFGLQLCYSSDCFTQK